MLTGSSTLSQNSRKNRRALDTSFLGARVALFWPEANDDAWYSAVRVRSICVVIFGCFATLFVIGFVV